MISFDVNPLVDSWNETLSVVAKLANVPAALVMRLSEDDIMVFSRNDTKDNPYHIGDAETFEQSGLYCEHVVKTQQPLCVKNALTDKDWQNNPDIALGMIAYLGVPINDSDGHPFGTICVLDRKERQFDAVTLQLLVTLKNNFESQLKLLSLQRAEEEKVNFNNLFLMIAGLAHEINTPLGVSLTAASIIENELGQLTAQLADKSLTQASMKTSLSLLNSSCEALLKNLSVADEKVVGIQRVSANEASYEKSTCKVEQVILDVIKLYRLKFEQLGIQCHYNDEHYQFCMVFISQNLLMQVISALFQNAIEHGLLKAAKPQLTIALSNSSSFIFIDVMDNGEGVDRTLVDKLFIPFVTSKRNKGYSGLGLSLVKRVLTQDMQGDIELIPSDKGAHFRIKIPIN